MKSDINISSVQEYYFTKNGRFNRLKFLKDNSYYKDYINDNIPYQSLDELSFRLKTKYFDYPNCPVCGTALKFLNSKMRFQNHCSAHCAAVDEKTQEKVKATNLQKYEVERFNNHAKQRETMLTKYSVESALSKGELRNKAKQTKLQKYEDENYSNPQKTTQTCKERYGTGRNNRKAEETMLSRYGVKSYLISDEVNKMRNNEDIQTKIQMTKHQNGTFNSSDQEEAFYIDLCQKYGKEHVYRNYKCERYPYRCDFYVKTTDLFIEVNFHPTHGKHPFDKNNEKDIKEIERLGEKNSKFYNNIINVWTVRDVKKFECAKQNKLNYIAIYPEGEFSWKE